jgi:hypothetical protein
MLIKLVADCPDDIVGSRWNSIAEKMKGKTASQCCEYS